MISPDPIPELPPPSTPPARWYYLMALRPHNLLTAKYGDGYGLSHEFLRVMESDQLNGRQGRPAYPGVLYGHLLVSVGTGRYAAEAARTYEKLRALEPAPARTPDTPCAAYLRQQAGAYDDRLRSPGDRRDGG